MPLSIVLRGAALYESVARHNTSVIEPGKGSHLIVLRDGRKSVLPMHGKSKELKTGLVEGIKKDLGLK